MAKKKDALKDSSLYGDLSSESHDSLYRAMSYIRRYGGPALIGSSDDMADLRSNRMRYLEWLSRRRDADKIIGEYEEFRRRWSPIYED
jgi:hypothetical protein